MAIQITDLRCGNYIRRDDGIDIFQITEINKNGRNEYVSVFTGEYYTSFDASDISGIPITKELLIEKCEGWQENSICVAYKISNRTEIRYYGGYGFCISIEMSDSYDHTEHELPHINYLHHVQNLIHSLTGQEMAIKL